jgi:hypothetical protein
MSRLALVLPVLPAAALALASGCNAGPVVPEDGSVTIGDVTYHGDVRPVLARHCVGCHSVGGIAPFPLDGYAAAQAMNVRIAQVTRARTMPPWLADSSGSCRTFRDARWMSEHEIAVLEAWRDQGAPEGNPATPAPEVPQLPTLTGDVSRLDVGGDYAPDRSQADDYRCFVVEAPIAAGLYYVTGSAVTPGDPRIVHHVIAYAPLDDAAGDEARALDATEDGAGYTCFGGPGVIAPPVALWAPGAGAILYPARTGIELHGGRPLVVQVHYNLAAGVPETARLAVDLQIATRGVVPAFWVPIGDYDMELAPRLASVSTSAGASLRDLTGLPYGLRAFGSAPHMHTLGRALRVELERASTEECLVDVPRWDFGWQTAYFYEQPVRIGPDDRVTITCTYDTTTRTDVVRWGEGTDDEMCIDFLYLSL